MEYVLIGRIVNTHGIKGELRLISDFKYKDKVFKKDFNIYIGKNKIKETIVTYRKHKEYDMVTLEGYNNINQVLKYLKEDVYVLLDDLNLDSDEYLDDDLIGMDVYCEKKLIGQVSSIRKVSEKNKILEVVNQARTILIPYHKDFIMKLDLQKREIEVKLIKGMI